MVKELRLDNDYRLKFVFLPNYLHRRMVKEINEPYSDFGIYYLTIQCIHIRNGYTWNGANPGIGFLKYFTRDTDDKKTMTTGRPQLYYPTLIYNILYDTFENHCFSRKTIDLLFYEMCKDAGFRYSRLYYLVIRLLHIGIMGHDMIVKQMKYQNSIIADRIYPF
jgi:hypothetical protein